MKKISSLAIASVLILLFACTNESQTILIAGNAVGKAKVGMSVAQIREAIKPLVLDQGIAGFEGDVLFSVKEGANLVITFNEYYQKITEIEIFDPRYQTKEGIHVGMLLSEVEKKFGKVTELSIDEQNEDLEYVSFAKSPEDLRFRATIEAEGKRAGIYAPDQTVTTKFQDKAVLKTIIVNDWSLDQD
jgi:hypothetical protein